MQKKEVVRYDFTTLKVGYRKKKQKPTTTLFLKFMNSNQGERKQPEIKIYFLSLSLSLSCFFCLYWIYIKFIKVKPRATYKPTLPIIPTTQDGIHKLNKPHNKNHAKNENQIHLYILISFNFFKKSLLFTFFTFFFSPISN